MKFFGKELKFNNNKVYHAGDKPTPAEIGAAASSHTHSNYASTSHTHNYAGSSSAGGAANSATKATQDSAGQQINTTYIKGLSVSGKTITYTKGDGTTGTITTQDTNTTYSTGTASALGLTKLYTGTGTNTDGTMTQSAINTALNGKSNSGHTHNSITNQDTRNVDTTPTQMPLGLSVHLKSNGIDGLNDGGTYHSTLMIKGWNDVSGSPWGQMAITANNNLYFRSSNSDTWNAWKKVSLDGHTHNYAAASHTHNYAGSSSAGGNANAAVKLATARTINGTNFDGSGNITTANWGTARNLTIGNTAKSVNGSANVAWTLSEIGAAPISHEQDYAGTSSNTYIAYPKDGRYRTNASSITGYLKITLPQSWTSTMMRFEVDVYNYVTNETMTYVIGGYNYNSSSWISYSACCISHSENAKRNLTVRFGHDGTKCAIYIGEASTTWAYTQVTVKNITVGYSNNSLTSWNSGWVVGFTTTLGTITGTVTNPYVGNGGMASTANTLATARTINGTSFNGSGNITTANWGTARNITIGSTKKSVNGSGDVAWSLSEIGAAAASHGNHVPATQTADARKFLRNDNTWQSLPTASTSATGIVQLNDATNSTSTTQAATANAVKKAYDRAEQAFQTGNNVKQNLVDTLIAKGSESVSTSNSWEEIIEMINKSNINLATPLYTVEIIAGVPYGFVLMGDGYYESVNQGISSSYAMCKVVIPPGKSGYYYMDCINYGENGYDYGIISQLNKTLPMDNSGASYTSTTVLHTFHNSSSPNVQTVSLGQLPDGGFFYVKYRKDNITNEWNDSLKFKVRLSDTEEGGNLPSGDIVIFDGYSHADEIGGGYNHIASADASYQSLNNGQFRIYAQGSSGSTDTVYAKKAINLTNYTSLEFTGYSATSNSSTYTSQIGFYANGDSSKKFVAYANFNKTTSATRSINVSNLKGEYVLAIRTRISSESGSVNVYISNITLLE